MDTGVREPTEIIEGEMTVAEDVRHASHIEVPPTIFELVDAHLDAQRERSVRSSVAARRDVRVSTWFATRQAALQTSR